ncbi:hypothetical protein M3694_07210 [Kocuria marina]|uniref:hypothetical protein n=1 Tax=Kocuria marina TaxID=223184 RepID=UPI002989ECF1|nr:hypothetical protein [Kocuria marina]MCT2361520.1 hypothetical protein [Kocuria marina]
MIEEAVELLDGQFESWPESALTSFVIADWAGSLTVGPTAAKLLISAAISAKSN